MALTHHLRNIENILLECLIVPFPCLVQYLVHLDDLFLCLASDFPLFSYFMLCKRDVATKHKAELVAELNFTHLLPFQRLELGRQLSRSKITVSKLAKLVVAPTEDLASTLECHSST